MRLCYLKHRSNTRATSNHTHILDVSLFHFLGFSIPNHELRVSLVEDVSTDACNAHFSAFLSPVDELGEETASRVLEITQVHFDQQIDIAIIHHFRKRVIEPSMFFFETCLFIHYFSLKLQILTCVMPKGSSIAWQSKPIHESVCG